MRIPLKTTKKLGKYLKKQIGNQTGCNHIETLLYYSMDNTQGLR